MPISCEKLSNLFTGAAKLDLLGQLREHNTPSVELGRFSEGCIQEVRREGLEYAPTGTSTTGGWGGCRDEVTQSWREFWSAGMFFHTCTVDSKSSILRAPNRSTMPRFSTNLQQLKVIIARTTGANA